MTCNLSDGSDYRLYYRSKKKCRGDPRGRPACNNLTHTPSWSPSVTPATGARRNVGATLVVALLATISRTPPRGRPACNNLTHTPSWSPSGTPANSLQKSYAHPLFL